MNNDRITTIQSGASLSRHFAIVTKGKRQARSGRIVRALRSLLLISLSVVGRLPGQQTSQFQGSVPIGRPITTSLTLTLDDAIQRGLKANLGLLERVSYSKEARAERIRALSALLPQVTGSFDESVEQSNLQSLGLEIKIPPALGVTIPTIVGPYQYMEVGASVSTRVMDWAAIKSLRSARATESAALLSQQDARDVVVQAVANAYLLVLADASSLESIRAQMNTAEALFRRAVDQESAGTSPEIDVLRAEVELKTQHQRFLAEQNQSEKDKLSLGRIIGLPAGQEFAINDRLSFAPLPRFNQVEAQQIAREQREDYQSARRLVQAAEESLSAARGERYPTVHFNGFYGDGGSRLNHSHSVFSATAAINFNIFDGGRIDADEQEARARLKQRSDELADLDGQIDVQVREGFLDIQTAAEQVNVAQINLTLANRTLEQAKDRFTARVTDTIELVQAQETVAKANDALIAALYEHNIAKVSLARVLGVTEQQLHEFIQVG